jgi:hypothetical protein
MSPRNKTIRVACDDLFGRWSTSNAYVFWDPQPQFAGVPATKLENPIGTPNQENPIYLRPVLRERIEAQSTETRLQAARGNWRR